MKNRRIIYYFFLPLILVRNWYIRVFKNKVDDPEIYGLMILMLLFGSLFLGLASLFDVKLTKFIFALGLIVSSLIFYFLFNHFYSGYESNKEIEVKKSGKYIVLTYFVIAALIFFLGIKSGNNVFD